MEDRTPDNGKTECQVLNLATDKIASSEGHNKSEIMSAPIQVGVLGDGDTEIGAALSLGESGLDLITNKK
jgi:hypothetical protein